MTAILVAIDGSKSSLRALDYAVKQAQRLKAALHVLNVQPPVETYGTVPAYLSAREHRELTMPAARDIVERAAARAARARVACQQHVIYGDVAPTIVRTARRLGCQSIVMGTRGLGPIGDLLLGSVATKVVHLTRIPVTLVK
jgi:nucleotide-binding universal stress UspA family protein